ncbi:undecaprenyl-phosphate glucose phosphotransferase [Pontibacter ruber]|uniref:Undecaprenyl-phosphate glucose phosphotransferase n=1 Tax=Pontibacter ruber TaxID=1343895 RepID=A0ABW5CZY7_9BACT|nr:undecaprenyl-phosphate glucose phosphotransferase [Pontibacter ruber]
MDKSKPLRLSLYFGGDLITLFVTFFIAFYFFKDTGYGVYNSDLLREFEWAYFISFVLLWGFISYWQRLYDFSNSNGFSKRAFNYIKAYLILLILVFLFHSLFPFPQDIRSLTIAIVLGFPALGIPINLILINLISLSKYDPVNKKYTLVAGVGNVAKKVEKNLHTIPKSQYVIKGYIDCKKEDCAVAQDKIVGDIECLNQYLRDNPVDEIVIALPVKPSKKIRSIIEAADYHGVRVKYMPDYEGLFGDRYKTIRYGQFEAINVRQLPLDETFSFLIKNSFDKVFALFAMLLLSPLFLVLAVLIKLESPGPVFYCPIRIGKGGKPFKVFKFRSMRDNDAAFGGSLSTTKDDPRITKIGKLIRKYSIDELPQFVNVLLGNMSVVGPRPHRSYLNQQLQASEDKYMIRHYFKPGITGWAQVNGWRGPTETKEQKSQRTKHDIWYMENWSLLLDLKIIFMTIFNRKVHRSAF